jgi:NADPH2:quinone reductase
LISLINRVLVISAALFKSFRFDWNKINANRCFRKRVVWQEKPFNSGDDIAGTVHAVGSNVYEFKTGDRVAAFHEMGTAGGSYAEYAVAWKHTTFFIPSSTSFPEAATLPLAAMTAAAGLYVRLGLLEPWSPARLKEDEKTPLLIYVAATAVGAFDIQLAKASGLGPVTGVAGKAVPFAETLIDKSKGDAIFDYRKGDDAVVSGIKLTLKAAGLAETDLNYVFDTVSEGSSFTNIAAVINPTSGQTTYVLPAARFAPGGFKYPDGVKSSLTMVGSVHDAGGDFSSPDDDKDFGYVWFRYFTRLLEDGRLKAHPFKERGGLQAVGEPLKDLKAGKASATKYVFKIADTPGL